MISSMPVYQFEDNPLTEEGFELGRKLFYDGRLRVTPVLPARPAISKLLFLGPTSTTEVMGTECLTR
jgi:hypothetical protein